MKETNNSTLISMAFYAKISTIFLLRVNNDFY